MLKDGRINVRFVDPLLLLVMKMKILEIGRMRGSERVMLKGGRMREREGLYRPFRDVAASTTLNGKGRYILNLDKYILQFQQIHWST